MMQLNVHRELRQALGSVSEYALSEQSLKLDGHALGPLQGSLTLLRTDSGLLATLRATATVQEECARCLATLDCEMTIEFEEEYVPVLDALTGARIHPPPGDAFRIGPDFVLDLREALRQYFLMYEPAKPLCAPSCAGLCPGCGANLNLKRCRCDASDERWSVLAGLRSGFEEGGE